MCWAHPAKAWLTLVPLGLLTHTRFLDTKGLEQARPTKTHTLTVTCQKMAWCWLLWLRASDWRRLLLLGWPPGWSLETKPLHTAQRPSGPASCRQPCWLSWGPCPQRNGLCSLKTPRLPEPEGKRATVFWLFLWQKFYLLKYSLYAESQLNDIELLTRNINNKVHLRWILNGEHVTLSQSEISCNYSSVGFKVWTGCFWWERDGSWSYHTNHSN